MPHNPVVNEAHANLDPPSLTVRTSCGRFGTGSVGMECSLVVFQMTLFFVRGLGRFRGTTLRLTLNTVFI
jgi:hypothetical protein